MLTIDQQKQIQELLLAGIDDTGATTFFSTGCTQIDIVAIQLFLAYWKTCIEQQKKCEINVEFDSSVFALLNSGGISDLPFIQVSKNQLRITNEKK